MMSRLSSSPHVRPSLISTSSVLYLRAVQLPARQSRRKVVTCAWSRCPAGGRWLTEGSCPTCPRRAGAPSPTCRHRPRACRTWTPPWSPTPGCSPGRTPAPRAFRAGDASFARQRRRARFVAVVEEAAARSPTSASDAATRRLAVTRRLRVPTLPPRSGTATRAFVRATLNKAGSSRWLQRARWT